MCGCKKNNCLGKDTCLHFKMMLTMREEFLVVRTRLHTGALCLGGSESLINVAATIEFNGVVWLEMRLGGRVSYRGWHNMLA